MTAKQVPRVTTKMELFPSRTALIPALASLHASTPMVTRTPTHKQGVSGVVRECQGVLESVRESQGVPGGGRESRSVREC